MKLKIKKGAKVQVITGSSEIKGKTGTVLEVDPTRMRVRIQGLKILTKHTKQDGIVKTEGFVHYSNVKLVEDAPAKKKATKKASKEKSA